MAAQSFERVGSADERPRPRCRATRRRRLRVADQPQRPPRPASGRARAVDEGHIRNEPIAAAMDGLNNLRLLRIVAKRRPDLADRDLEHGVANEDSRPDGVEQVVLRDQAAAVLGEAPQQGKGLGRERDLLAAAPDTLVRPIELERPDAGARRRKQSVRTTVGRGRPGRRRAAGHWRDVASGAGIMVDMALSHGTEGGGPLRSYGTTVKRLQRTLKLL